MNVGFSVLDYPKRESRIRTFPTPQNKMLEELGWVPINPSEPKFFDNVLKELDWYLSDDINLIRFCSAVAEVKAFGLGPFWRNRKELYRPEYKYKYDDSFDSLNKFVNGKKVCGKRLRIGSEFQYYAFLVYIVNKLVEGGCNVETAINALFKWHRAKETFFTRGLGAKLGFSDLASTCWVLKASCEKGKYWFASGFGKDSYYSLATLTLIWELEERYFCPSYSNLTPWIIMEG